MGALSAVGQALSAESRARSVSRTAHIRLRSACRSLRQPCCITMHLLVQLVPSGPAHRPPQAFHAQARAPHQLRSFPSTVPHPTLHRRTISSAEAGSSCRATSLTMTQLCSTALMA